MTRYEAGETLASIARTYDCSPPAISYVVSRSRARQPNLLAVPAPVSPTEPQLIKAAPPDVAGGSAQRDPDIRATIVRANVVPPNAVPPANGRAHETTAVAATLDADAPRQNATPLHHQINEHHRNGTGEQHATLPGLPPRAPLPSHRTTPGPASSGPVSSGPSLSGAASSGPANGDQRRTLHLSLGQSQHNGTTHATESAASERHEVADYVRQPQSNASTVARGGMGVAEDRPIAYEAPIRSGDADSGHRPDNAHRKDVGNFIDQELRARVNGDIAVFLAAFDAALAADTQQSRSALREATDRLLRAGARTRIELERLEARMPLQARDNGGRSEPAWRHRQ